MCLQLVVPKDQQNAILQEINGERTGAHPGEERTFKKLQEWLYWPGYSQSVKEWCQNYQEAATVATKLIDKFCRFGMPDQLHSDMGAQFESALIKEVSKLLAINKTHTTPYHPQRDSLVERLNRIMLAMLPTMVDEHGEDWENHLSKICFVYNTCEYASTGFSSFYLMFGRQAKIPLDIVYGSHTTAVMTPSKYASKLRQSLEQSYQLTHKHSLGAACR